MILPVVGLRILHWAVVIAVTFGWAVPVDLLHRHGGIGAQGVARIYAFYVFVALFLIPFVIISWQVLDNECLLTLWERKLVPREKEDFLQGLGDKFVLPFMRRENGRDDGKGNQRSWNLIEYVSMFISSAFLLYRISNNCTIISMRTVAVAVCLYILACLSPLFV